MDHCLVIWSWVQCDTMRTPRPADVQFRANYPWVFYAHLSFHLIIVVQVEAAAIYIPADLTAFYICLPCHLFARKSLVVNLLGFAK